MSLSLPTMFTRTPTTVSMRQGPRLIGRHTHTHTHRRGGSLFANYHRAYPPHTHKPWIPISACALQWPPPTERTGLAEYSRSFQFFRQVREPPSRHAAPSHSRELEFQQSLAGSSAVPSGRDLKEKGLNCLSLLFILPSSRHFSSLYGSVIILLPVFKASQYSAPSILSAAPNSSIIGEVSQSAFHSSAVMLLMPLLKVATALRNGGDTTVRH